MNQERKFRKLEKIAGERGIPLETLIPDLVDTLGLRGAANELGVFDNTIRNWGAQNGYIITVERRAKMVKRQGING